MKGEDYEIVPSGDPISRSGIEKVLNNIRPSWKGKNLIQRVERLLPVDASSACQRLFNAAIHDLKEKMIVIGVDLAKEVAVNYKLPGINTDDDLLNYNVSKTIDLSYRIGILSRSEWRRLHRCYEIRRDLEHEDNEYEAVLEDCFYIFKSAIDIVLSKDPIELLKVTDVKQLIELSTKITPSQEFLANYKNAPKLRQREINELLVSYAFDDKKPDIVRENTIELMRNIKDFTFPTVIIEIAAIIETRYTGNGIDLKTAKISYACGAIAYFKKIKLNDFYSKLFDEIGAAADNWRSQTQVALKLEDIGGIANCPQEIYKKMLRKLVLFYIGEESYGPGSVYRNVFFSNAAAPIIARIIQNDAKRVAPLLEELRIDSRINISIKNQFVLRRFEALIDLTEVE
jgi:hypothetical protein